MFYKMIARNNIFNIRVGSKWVGLDGSYKGFCCFASVDYAIRAWLVLMRTYRAKYLCTTIEAVVSRFAPPTENDTKQYVNYVSRCSNIPRDCVLELDDDYYEVAVWMARLETGYKLKSADVRRVARRFNIVIVPRYEVRCD